MTLLNSQWRLRTVLGMREILLTWQLRSSAHCISASLPHQLRSRLRGALAKKQQTAARNCSKDRQSARHATSRHYLPNQDGTCIHLKKLESTISKRTGPQTNVTVRLP